MLTLFTGLKENPVIVFVSGKYDLVHSRLLEGRINYNLVRDDLVDIGMLVNGTDAKPRQPRRGPQHLHPDVRPQHLRTEVQGRQLSARLVQELCADPRKRHRVPPVYPGQLRGLDGRPRGASGERERLRSRRRAVPQVSRTARAPVRLHDGPHGAAVLLGRRQLPPRDPKQPVLRAAAAAQQRAQVGLFQVEPADQAADVCVCVDQSGWFASFVSFAYGVISIVMISQGVIAAVLRSKVVLYLPKPVRFLKEQRYLRYLAPSMSLATMLAEDENAVIHFKGALLMASDTWLNHWLYIAFRILEALVNVRLTYVVYQMGAWMLKKKVNLENFLFVCAALTRMTWIMCFFHSLLRLGTKLALRSLKTLKLIRPHLRDRIEWYVDASAPFLSFKVYSVLMGVFLYMFLKINGSTTLMKQEVPAKRGVLGGLPGIAKLWGNEIICDYFVILSLLTLHGLAVGSLILCTKYRLVASNGLIQLLQQRYVFVSWDIFVTMEALEIDPFNPKLVVDNVVRTNCLIGCVLQQLYCSGPSDLVQLAGDYIFQDGGFSKEPIPCANLPKKALLMGLVQSTRGSTASTYRTKYTASPSVDESKISPQTIKARILDSTTQGNYHTNSAGFTIFEVHDALTTMSILDIKHLLGNEKKLHIT